MDIVNLDGRDEFSEAVCQLEKKIIESTFNPDLVIGIPSGGKFVVQEMNLLEPINGYFYIVKRRPSSKNKKKLGIGNFLPFIPRSINNKIRLVESFLLECSFNKKRPAMIDEISLPIEIDKDLVDVIKKSNEILIVDDAIDSGKTIKSVVDTVYYYSSGALVRTAVINTTFENPLMLPDWSLYTRTIVRYPWASDVRKIRK